VAQIIVRSGVAERATSWVRIGIGGLVVTLPTPPLATFSSSDCRLDLGRLPLLILPLWGSCRAAPVHHHIWLASRASKYEDFGTSLRESARLIFVGDQECVVSYAKRLMAMSAGQLHYKPPRGHLG